jgi:LCP family protein required for cell wall assembly
MTPRTTKSRFAHSLRLGGVAPRTEREAFILSYTTTKETRFLPPWAKQKHLRSFKNLISILLVLIVLTACGPTPDTSVQPTPTVPPPHPAAGLSSVTVRQRPAPLPTSRPQPEPTAVLLLGADRRNPDEGISNTDTLMLLHLDPDAQRVAIISLPRDLYVGIPGHEQGRINAAYALGERDGTGGLALARQAVSATLGIPVQHAALVDFDAFVTLIDAVGGVDVDAPHAISDPTYPDSGIGYDPFYLSAGPQHLDGATALKYARTRATSGGDFDRTTRQRQLVLAVRDRVTRLDLLRELIAQSPQLWATLQTTFETDLTLNEIVDLAVIASRIPADQVVTASIDQTCTVPWTTPGGAQVLLPDRVAIETLLDDLLTPSPF